METRTQKIRPALSLSADAKRILDGINRMNRINQQNVLKQTFGAWQREEPVEKTVETARKGFSFRHWKRNRLQKPGIRFFLLLVLLGVSGCEKLDDPSADRIANSIKKEGRIVQLSDHTDFEWDQLYIFPPYFPFDDIDQMISIRSDRSSALLETSVDEGDCFFVFLKDGVFVRSFYFPRYSGDFSLLKPGPYSPETARFKAQFNDDWSIRGRWKIMELVSPIL